MSDGPLIVQSDRTVLLEVAHPDAEDARHDLAVFAELERAPEHIHTYRITRLGLWNARAAGHTADDMLATLERYSKFPVPQTVVDRHHRDRRPLRPARHRARRRRRRSLLRVRPTPPCSTEVVARQAHRAAADRAARRTTRIVVDAVGARAAQAGAA